MWWSIIAFVLCTVGGILAVRAVAADIAERDAALRGGSFARNVAAPLVNREVRRGDPEHTRTLDTVMRNRMRDGSIVRIKIWAADGTVIWSDAPRIKGRRFTIDPEDAELFGTNQVTSSISDLSKPENAQERGYGELLEVYAGATDEEGVPVVVESYWSTDRILRDEVVISSRIVPLMIGVLLVFMLAVLPLAFSLARRVDRAQADRAGMLRHALAASDLERRRISRELHDGLIQDLTSLGYALPSVASQLPPGPSAAKEVLDSVRSSLQRDISSLRGILTELYPANLAQEGLAAAVEQLAAPVREQGLEVEVLVDEAVDDAPPEAIQLAYQVMREGLRNVVKHAQASRATLTAGIDGDDVLVTVTDDGVGLGDSPPDRTHLGIRMLQDDAADIGGSVTVRTVPSGGARLTARFPQDFAWSWDSPKP